MYECYCYEGYYLHSNGYNCIAFNATSPEDGGDGVDDSSGNISIQIEVDIEPPAETDDADKLSEDQLAQLGLPSKHIHYTAGGAADVRQHNTAELLQPADIQVSYADTDTDTLPRERPGHVILWPGRDSDARGDTVQVPELEYEEIAPPRALPDTAEGVAMDDRLEDNIYTVDAFCGLQCGGGQCRIMDNGVKRCLCPPGWGGDSCQDMIMISGVPKLSGYSHLTLPTLQNAYSDLHMALDFKPESWTGIILITGQTDDMTGDYLALILNDGYVELRLDCGTGVGVVRSTSQVHLQQW